MSDTPYVVIGIGCQRGCPLTTLDALLDQVLETHRIERSALKALASIEQKRDEPGLLALAEQLGVPLMFYNSKELADYEPRLSQRSQIAYERTGCYGVAESAALALADHLGQGDAQLLVVRQKFGQATLALASTAPNPR